jgi:hypothetical protein
MISIEERLKILNDKLPADRVNLAEILDICGQDGLLLVSVFLTIIFLFPVSVPGISTVFGAAILQIGCSRLMKRDMKLPKRFNERMFPVEKIRCNLNRGIVWLKKLQSLSRPDRLRAFTRPGLVGAVNECALITGAVLLMAPFGLVPFSNTLPALAIMFLALGFLYGDGLFIIMGHAANIITIAYFTLLITGSGTFLYYIIRHKIPGLI